MYEYLLDTCNLVAISPLWYVKYFNLIIYETDTSNIFLCNRKLWIIRQSRAKWITIILSLISLPLSITEWHHYFCWNNRVIIISCVVIHYLLLVTAPSILHYGIFTLLYSSNNEIKSHMSSYSLISDLQWSYTKNHWSHWTSLIYNKALVSQSAVSVTVCTHQWSQSQIRDGATAQHQTGNNGKLNKNKILIAILSAL